MNHRLENIYSRVKSLIDAKKALEDENLRLKESILSLQNKEREWNTHKETLVKEKETLENNLSFHTLAANSLNKKELKEKILNKTLLTDKAIYLFTISNGFLPSHSRKIISQLTKDNKIEKSNFNLSTKICKLDAIITSVKIL